MAEPWNPLRDLMLLQDRMNRLFEDVTHRRAGAGVASEEDVEVAEWYPAADVYEKDSEFEIVVDLPGLDRSALEISVDDNRLSLKGNRKIESVSSPQAERPRGRFMRTFSVPGSVDQGNIQADYQDGVLKLRLPKRAEPKAQRIEIKVQ